MKIKPLLFGSGWYPTKANGLDKYFYELLMYLNSKHICSYGIVEANTSLKNKGPVSTPNNTLKILNDFKPNIISIHFYNIINNYLGNISHIPKVMHFHTPWAYELLLNNKRSMFKEVLEKETTLYNLSDKIITLSQAFKETLIDKYKISDEKIEVIAGGVNTSIFNLSISKEETRGQLGYPLNRRIIVVVRRLIKRTGIDNLIKAINIVKTKHPDILVLIAGDGELKSSLETLVNKLNLNNNIIFLGYVSNNLLPRLYKVSDFTIVPSTHYEGFGISVVESLASGRPVLVTPNEGLKEIITPFNSEWVIENIGVSALIDKLMLILGGNISLSNSEECINYSKQYDWEVVGPKIIDLYKDLL